MANVTGIKAGGHERAAELLASPEIVGNIRRQMAAEQQRAA